MSDDKNDDTKKIEKEIDEINEKEKKLKNDLIIAKENKKKMKTSRKNLKNLKIVMIKINR
jgi:hypothetical protein